MTTAEDFWETYPVRYVDGAKASIVYNHGVSETINSSPLNRFVSFSLHINKPDEDGFAELDEVMAVNAVGDQILLFTDAHGGLFAGQLCLDGQCHFYTYNEAAEETIQALIQQIQQDYGYQLEYSVQTDAEKRRYWDDLFPDPYSWQLICDMKITTALQEAGVDLTVPHRLDHYASFHSDSSLDAFSTWAMGQGFDEEARSQIAGDDQNGDQYRIHFSRSDPPNLAAIHPVTRVICAKCLELGGSYDGWKAS